MTLEQTPAPARSDVRRQAVAAPDPTRPYLKRGRLLTAGALAWALSMALVTGIAPAETGGERVAFGIGSGLFQVGLMGLLTVLWQSQAIGSGRLARFFLRPEAVILTLAMASTFVDTIGVSDLDSVQWILLDMCWPLSMLGMFFIGIRIAIHGRWKGASRWWPMVAESWAVVTVPTLGVFGETAAGFVAVLHLLVGYCVLGLLVARKER